MSIFIVPDKVKDEFDGKDVIDITASNIDEVESILVNYYGGKAYNLVDFTSLREEFIEKANIGGSKVEGLMIMSQDSLGIVDVTLDALVNGITTTNGLYLSSSNDTEKIRGFEFSTTDLQTVDVEIEIWDGSEWTEVNYMLIGTTKSYANADLEIINQTLTGNVKTTFQVYIDKDIIAYGENTTVNGVNSRWIKITSTNNNFTASDFKILYDKNLSDKILVDFQKFISTYYNGGNKKLYAGGGVYAGIHGNKMTKGKKTINATTVSLPKDIDTSSKVKVSLYFTTDVSNNNPRNIYFSAEWSILRVGESQIFTTTRSANGSPDSFAVDAFVAVTKDDNQKLLYKEIEIEIPNGLSLGNVSDILVLNIIRNGDNSDDTHTKDVSLIDAVVYYKPLN